MVLYHESWYHESWVLYHESWVLCCMHSCHAAAAAAGRTHLLGDPVRQPPLQAVARHPLPLPLACQARHRAQPVQGQRLAAQQAINLNTSNTKAHQHSTTQLISTASSQHQPASASTIQAEPATRPGSRQSAIHQPGVRACTHLLHVATSQACVHAPTCFTYLMLK